MSKNIRSGLTPAALRRLFDAIAHYRAKGNQNMIDEILRDAVRMDELAHQYGILLRVR